MNGTDNPNDNQSTGSFTQLPNNSFEVMSNDSNKSAERREEYDIDQQSFTKSDTSETLSQKISTINPSSSDQMPPETPIEKQGAAKQKKEIHLQNYNLEEPKSEIREDNRAQDKNQQTQAAQQQHKTTAQPTSSDQTGGPAILDVCLEAQKGNFLPAIRCLTLGIMPKDYLDSNGYNVLHHAISYNNFDVALLLLDHFKIDVNLKSKTNQSCLMVAASFGNVELTKILLDRGAKIDEQDSTGFTAALYALRQSHPTCLFYLIAKGANLSLGDTNGCTIVHWAAFRNNVFLLKFLERIGLNMNAGDLYGFTPLTRAIASEAVQAVKYFLNDLKIKLPENYQVDQIQHNGLKKFILKQIWPNEGFWGQCLSSFYQKSPQVYTFVFYAVNLALGLLFYCQAAIGEYKLSYVYDIIFVVFTIYFGVYTCWYFLLSSNSIPKLKKFAYSKLSRHQGHDDLLIMDDSSREMTTINRYKQPYIDNLISSKDLSQSEAHHNPEYPFPSFLHEIYFNVENGEFDKALLFEENRYCPRTLILKKAKTKYCKRTRSSVEGFYHYSHTLQRPIDSTNHLFYLLLLIQQTVLLFIFLLANLILFYDQRLSSLWAIIPETAYLLSQKTSIFAGVFLALAFCYFGYSLIYTLIELYCVAKNLTHNELIKPYKYPYLYTIDKNAPANLQTIKFFLNPYDRVVLMKLRKLGFLMLLSWLSSTLSLLSLFLMLTSIFWVSAIILFSPFLGSIYLFLRYTKAGNSITVLAISLWNYIAIKTKGPRRFFLKELYDFACSLFPQVQYHFLNHGYAVLNADGLCVTSMPEKFMREIFSAQLYHYCVTGMGSHKNLQEKVILEVGSGRGGGISYINSIFSPKLCVGVDESASQVEFCREEYKCEPNLKFYQGKAENLKQKFLSEVRDQLKPSGKFCFADFRQTKDILELEEDFKSEGWEIVEKEDISVNLIHALKLSEKQSKGPAVKSTIQKWVLQAFKEVIGLPTRDIQEALRSRKTVYSIYILKKRV